MAGSNVGHLHPVDDVDLFEERRDNAFIAARGAAFCAVESFHRLFEWTAVSAIIHRRWVHGPLRTVLALVGALRFDLRAAGLVVLVLDPTVVTVKLQGVLPKALFREVAVG